MLSRFGLGRFNLSEMTQAVVVSANFGGSYRSDFFSNPRLVTYGEIHQYVAS